MLNPALLPTSFLGVALIGNFILLAINAVVFAAVLTKSRKINKRYDEIEDKYSKLINEASEQAVEILRKAGVKSKTLLTNIKVNTETIQKSLKQSFADAAGKQTVDFNKAIVDINHDYNAFLSKLQNQLKSDTSGMVTTVVGFTRTEIQKFISKLQQETISSQQKFGESIAKEFKLAIQQVRSYREEQLTLVEESINAIILKITKAVLSEAISITEHERLIFEALEKAKKEEVFDELLRFDTKKKRSAQGLASGNLSSSGRAKAIKEPGPSALPQRNTVVSHTEGPQSSVSKSQVVSVDGKVDAVVSQKQEVTSVPDVQNGPPPNAVASGQVANNTEPTKGVPKEDVSPEGA